MSDDMHPGMPPAPIPGTACTCGRPITVVSGKQGRCRWRLVDGRWTPGCEAAPTVTVPVIPGSGTALEQVLVRQQKQDNNRGGRHAKPTRPLLPLPRRRR
jgi:hypothetical protein